MKKFSIVAALAVAALAGSINARAAEGAPIRPLLGLGLTNGGDKLVTVQFTDGSTSNVKAGDQVVFYGGAEFRLGDRLGLQATVGYHSADSKAASNGSVKFTRVPVDLLLVFSATDNVRLGAGVQFVNSPQLKGSGLGSNLSQKFDSTRGLIVEGEYLFSGQFGLKGRYVSEKYKVSGTNVKVDGSHLGLLFSVYF
jgi:Outer membrane protein beta-barrel domain